MSDSQSILHQVPFSTGRELPKIHVPPKACDSHHHIYDPNHFPYDLNDVRNQPPATVESYRLLQKRLGIERNVIVQASAYGTDNSCLVDALQQMGRKNTRGIAVCHSDISDAGLQRLAHAGVCGLRINLAAQLQINKVEEIVPLSERIAELGWHMQFWINADDIPGLKDMFYKLRCPIVFDHRGHIPQPQGIHHPAFQIIADLLKTGNAWIKLSGVNFDSVVGDPTYADVVAVGRAWAALAPNRMLWGTDWPHPTCYTKRIPFPDDAQTFDLLMQQVPDERNQYRVLVENPNELYHFE